MFNIENVKVSRLPKTTKFFSCEDGYFTINEDMVIHMFVKRDCNELKLSELRQEIEETERALDDISLCREERDELQSKLYSLESEYAYESETVRKLPYRCVFKSTSSHLIDLRLLSAKDAKKDSVRSVAYATGRRSVNGQIREDDILPDDRYRQYTWSTRRG